MPIFESEGKQDIGDAGKAQLSELARRQVALEAEVALLEEQLREAQDRLRAISEVSIPTLMDELGIDEIRLTTGERIAVKRGISASIPVARRAEAVAWLRENGAESIIKNTLTVQFGKGEDEEAAALLADIRSRGAPVEQTVTVHPQTLGAYVRERLSDGLDVPMDLLGVHEYARTKVSRAA